METAGLSSHELELLRLGVVMKAALSEPVNKPDKPSKPLWLQVLESGTVAALVTVLIGGWFGSTITANYQAREKARQEAAANMKENLEKRNAAIQNAYELLSDGQYFAIGLVELTQPPLQPWNADLRDRRSLMDKRVDFIKAKDDFGRRWLKEKYTDGYLLAYYHDDNPNVRSAWRRCVVALDNLQTASNQRYYNYLQNPGRSQPPTSIQEEAAFISSLDKLAEELQKAKRT